MHQILLYSKSWKPRVVKKKYIPKWNSKVEGNFNSLHQFLNLNNFTQQENIICGNLIQDHVKDIVRHSPKAKIINLEHVCSKQIDLLFEVDNMIYYREIKTNTSLDSEKKTATYNKIQLITVELGKIYTNSVIDGKMMCPTWLYSSGSVEGYNDFLKILGYEPLSFDEFIELGKEIGTVIGLEAIK